MENDLQPPFSPVVPSSGKTDGLQPGRSPKPLRKTDPDGLEEYGDGFRNYEKPDGSAVAEILRRRRRMRTAARHPEASPAEPDAEVPPPAMADGAVPLEVETAPVKILSEGRTLIVGHDPDQIKACERLLSGRQPCLMVFEPAADTAGADRLLPPGVLNANGIRIRGCLGRFTAIAAIGGERIRLSRLLEGSPAYFDLILDLRSTAAGGFGSLLPGYYRPHCDNDLESALGELPQMIGIFEKPVFLRHEKKRCAHIGTEPEACSRCLEVCPAGAIRAVHGDIRIDNAACSGCGLCATVCPTGAMHCLQDSPQDLLVAVQGRLSEPRAAAQGLPIVVFYQDGAETVDRGSDAEDQPLYVPVSDIGRVGPEVWLSALAYGAGEVILRLPESYPGRLRAVLESELKWAGALLTGLGQSAERIQLSPGGDPERFAADIPATVGGPPAEFAPFQSKRALVLNSAAHLARGSDRWDTSTRLPEGAPFGEVIADPSACTLCMACAGACPTSALAPAGNLPSLSLVESECIQCGRCRDICPEQALTLNARIRPSVPAGELSRQLHAAEPLECINCGTPFAAPGLVQKMIASLEGHWMYDSGKDIRRLKMCRDCRIQAFFRDRKKKETS